MFIDEEIGFVKSQIDHHKRSIDHFRSRNDDTKVRRHKGILRRFEEILPKMEGANEALEKSGSPVHLENDKIGHRLGDVMELPEELRKQLVSFQFDEMEIQVIELVRDDLAGVATIDEILVGLYRKHHDLHQRDALATKIYRMTRKELLFSVTGRKGVYSVARDETPEQSTVQRSSSDNE